MKHQSGQVQIDIMEHRRVNRLTQIVFSAEAAHLQDEVPRFESQLHRSLRLLLVLLVFEHHRCSQAHFMLFYFFHDAVAHLLLGDWEAVELHVFLDEPRE